MGLTLEVLADDIRTVLKDRDIDEAAPGICDMLRGYLLDAEFKAEHLPERAKGAHPREVLYEDADLGFCICGHVYADAAETGPHDHGSSWAIYGQAEGTTEMTDWRIVEAGSGEDPSLVAAEKVYTLEPGDAHYYAVGAVHSPKREAPTRLIRIEGANLDHVRRSKIRKA